MLGYACAGMWLLVLACLDVYLTRKGMLIASTKDSEDPFQVGQTSKL